jgi:hypothetical protein
MMMDSPALSIVLASAGPFETVAATVRHLVRQNIAGDIELIIVTPSADAFELPGEVNDKFRSIRVVPVEEVLPIHLAFARGATEASANIVVFVEDHVFPQPGWAEALVERHREDWAVVGPVVQNANPTSAASWADFIVAYGPWCDGKAAGPASMLPGHNSSYKRAVLLGEGEDLAACLEAESVFHQELRRRGARLFLESRAVIGHLNFARLRVLLRVQWRYARQYAGRRSANWPVWRKLLYFFATPLIPLVRFVRLVRAPIVLPPHVSRVGVLGILLLDLLVDGFGQALGYLCGIGNSAEYLTSYEYNRVRFS